MPSSRAARGARPARRRAARSCATVRRRTRSTRSSTRSSRTLPTESLLLAKRQALHGTDRRGAGVPASRRRWRRALSSSRTTARRPVSVRRALHYWHVAGRRASERSANVEAISHLTKGLDLVATLPDTAEASTPGARPAPRRWVPCSSTRRGPGRARWRRPIPGPSSSVPLSPTRRSTSPRCGVRGGSPSTSRRSSRWRRNCSTLAERAGRPWPAVFRPTTVSGPVCSTWAGTRTAVSTSARASVSMRPETTAPTVAVYGGHDPKVCGTGERAFCAVAARVPGSGARGGSGGDGVGAPPRAMRARSSTRST